MRERAEQRRAGFGGEDHESGSRFRGPWLLAGQVGDAARDTGSAVDPPDVRESFLELCAEQGEMRAGEYSDVDPVAVRGVEHGLGGCSDRIDLDFLTSEFRLGEIDQF